MLPSGRGFWFSDNLSLCVPASGCDEVDAVTGRTEVVVEGPAMYGPPRPLDRAVFELKPSGSEHKGGEVSRDVSRVAVVFGWPEEDGVAANQDLHAQERVVQPAQLSGSAVDWQPWMPPRVVDDHHHWRAVDDDGVDRTTDGVVQAGSSIQVNPLDREILVLRDVDARNHDGHLSLVGVVPRQAWRGSSTRERAAMHA